MVRIFGSTFAVIVAAATLSFSAGCSSSDNTPADAGPTVCTQAQVDAIFGPKCNVCHDSTGSYAGLNLTSSGLVGRLVGVAPAGGGSIMPSVCTNMSKIYLTAGSHPATGLLIDKITSSNPGCGVRMPYLTGALSTTEIDCIKSWANTVTGP
jgi:hypothetical protein